MFAKVTAALVAGLIAGGGGVYAVVENETSHSVRCVISESSAEMRGLASSEVGQSFERDSSGCDPREQQICVTVRSRRVDDLTVC